MNLDIRHIWSFVLMLLLFSALLFTAGGGLHPGDEAGVFVYFKFTFFLLPYVTVAIIALGNPRSSMRVVTDILAENKVLLIYFAICFFSIPLSISAGYSLNRLVYTIYGTGSVLALAAVYYSWVLDPQARLRLVSRHLELLSLFSLLPLVFIAAGRVDNFLAEGASAIIPGIRDSFEYNLPVHPNVMSAFYALLFIWQFMRGNKFIASMLGIAIFVLFSRTVFFCMAGVAALYSALSFFWYARSSGFAFIFLGLGLAFGVLSLVLGGFLPMNDLLAPILRGGTVDEFMTLTNRTVLWNELLSQVDFKIALLGNGYAIMNEDFSVDFGTGYLYGTHNTYLSIFLGCGVGALLAYLCYLTSSYLKIRALRQTESRATVLAMICSVFFVFTNGFPEELIGHNTSPAIGYLVFMMSMVGARRWA